MNDNSQSILLKFWSKSKTAPAHDLFISLCLCYMILWLRHEIENKSGKIWEIRFVDFQKYSFGFLGSTVFYRRIRTTIRKRELGPAVLSDEAPF